MSEPKKSPPHSYFFLFKNGKTQFDFLTLLAKISFQVFVLYPEANYPAVSGLCQFVFFVLFLLRGRRMETHEKATQSVCVPVVLWLAFPRKNSILPSIFLFFLARNAAL